MKTIIFNDDNLNIGEIENKILKARAIMLNEKGEIFIMQYMGNYFLPGGGIEYDEDIVNGLLREVKEETGIELDMSGIEPFLCIKQLIKEYPKRGTERVLSSRFNETYYYIIYTNEDINVDKIELDENERKAFYETSRIKPEQILFLLNKKENSENLRNKYFTRELVLVMQELEKHL